MRTPRPHRQAVAEDSTEAAQQFWQTLDDRWLGKWATLRAELARSVNAVALQGAEVRNAARGRLSTSQGRLVGWSLRETAGAATVVYLRDGADAGGSIVAVIPLAANGGSTQWLGPGGASFVYGLYLDTAGAVEGGVYTGAVD